MRRSLPKNAGSKVKERRRRQIGHASGLVSAGSIGIGHRWIRPCQRIAEHKRTILGTPAPSQGPRFALAGKPSFTVLAEKRVANLLTRNARPRLGYHRQLAAAFSG